VLFSLANMAAHIHCLLRFGSLLRRLAAGSSPAGSRDGRRRLGSVSGTDLTGTSQQSGGEESTAVWDGGCSLGRPGSPQRAVRSKQPAGPRGGGGAAASRLGVSSADGGGGGAESYTGGSMSRSSWPSLRQLKAAYPFYPLWLVRPVPLCVCAVLCIAEGSRHQPVSSREATTGTAMMRLHRCFCNCHATLPCVPGRRMRRSRSRRGRRPRRSTRAM
jgi:hypothetical protein